MGNEHPTWHVIGAHATRTELPLLFSSSLDIAAALAAASVRPAHVLFSKGCVDSWQHLVSLSSFASGALEDTAPAPLVVGRPKGVQLGQHSSHSENVVVRAES